ncbi:DNA-directed RNA polymerase II subunit RPB7-like [Chironomus tepperi]|uniref:DNA-directed RNA polymerase II subunit RPB7-like n=1 Tax=Chironomus tepperi TaxID=113505 RepID=UPI00391F196E
MFYHMSLAHEVLIHPCYFGPDLRQIIEKKVYSEVEGSCQGYIGYIICVTAITNISSGTIMAGVEGMTSFPVKYNAIVFRPFKNEVFEGMVKQVTKVGIFIEIGPLTCFVSHNSLPDRLEFCTKLQPVCYKSKDEDGEIIAKDTDVRVKIVGLRTDINGMFAIGTLLEDYLGAIN